MSKKYGIFVILPLFVFLCLFFAMPAAAEYTGDLHNGSSGEAVIEIQNQLIILGYLDGIADGNFGPKTEQAVIDFQNNTGLDSTGVVNQKTYEALFGIYDDVELDEAVKIGHFSFSVPGNWTSEYDEKNNRFAWYPYYESNDGIIALETPSISGSSYTISYIRKCFEDNDIGNINLYLKSMLDDGVQLENSDITYINDLPAIVFDCNYIVPEDDTIYLERFYVIFNKEYTRVLCLRGINKINTASNIFGLIDRVAATVYRDSENNQETIMSDNETESQVPELSEDTLAKNDFESNVCELIVANGGIVKEIIQSNHVIEQDDQYKKVPSETFVVICPENNIDSINTSLKDYQVNSGDGETCILINYNKEGFIDFLGMYAITADGRVKKEL